MKVQFICYSRCSTCKKAEKWLDTEEYDFREREIMTKTAAIKLAGRKTVNNAIAM